MMPTWATWAAVIFASLVLVEILKGLVLLLRNLREEPKIHFPVGDDSVDSFPRLSVVMPAKDEESGIERSVQSVLVSDYPHLEVIVVNDRSSDSTGDILESMAAKDSRITAITISELPDGWTGKTHAMFRGAEIAKGDLLLFIDADTVVAADALTRCVSTYRDHGLDMLSLIPGFIRRGFIENVINPHLVIGLSYFYPLNLVNDQRSTAGIASGSFLLISRDAYEAVGTWRDFRREITEDVALSRAIKRAGRKLMVFRGDDLVHTREFRGISQACRYWKRVFYGGLERSVLKTARLLLNYSALIVIVLMFVYAGALLVTGQSTPSRAALFLVSALCFGTFTLCYALFTHRESGTWAYAFSSPVGLVVGVWVTLSTLAALVNDKGISWRGSTYK